MAEADVLVQSQAELEALLRGLGPGSVYGPNTLVAIDAPVGAEIHVLQVRPGMPRQYRALGRSLVLAHPGAKGGRNEGIFEVFGSATLRGTGCNYVIVAYAGIAEVADTRVEARGRGRVVCERSRVEVADHATVEAIERPETVANLASRVQARDRAVVTLRGWSRAVVQEHVQVTAYDDALVEANAVNPFYGTIRLHDRARVLWRDAARVTADHPFTIEADGDAVVRVDVPPLGEVTIVARDRAAVRVGGQGVATIRLEGQATADVGTGARVEAHGQSRVVARGKAKVRLFDQAVCQEQGWDVEVADRRERAAPA